MGQYFVTENFTLLSDEEKKKEGNDVSPSAREKEKGKRQVCAFRREACRMKREGGRGEKKNARLRIRAQKSGRLSWRGGGRRNRQGSDRAWIPIPRGRKSGGDVFSLFLKGGSLISQYEKDGGGRVTRKRDTPLLSGKEKS